MLYSTKYALLHFIQFSDGCDAPKRVSHRSDSCVSSKLAKTSVACY